MKIGAHLKKLRKQRQLGVKVLAHKIKVDHSYLSRIESGIVQPSEHVVRRLASVLKCEEEELMLLANRVPKQWRTAIRRAPAQLASVIGEQLGEYGASTSILLPNVKRKSPSGISTNDLVFSAHMGTNDEVFPQILNLYVAPGSTIADVTFGRGVFWKQIPKDRFKVLASDLLNGVDFRNLPYAEGSLDCLVLDPPYMHTPGGTAHTGHQNYEGYYRNNRVSAANASEKKYHEAVLDLYFKAGLEAHRVLRPEGIFIVKCQDEVCANQQRLTHIELVNEFAQKGFIAEDVFVLVRTNRPGLSRVIRQRHARKNHSYFLVFRKTIGKRRWSGLKLTGH